MEDDSVKPRGSRPVTNYPIPGGQVPALSRKNKRAQAKKAAAQPQDSAARPGDKDAVAHLSHNDISKADKISAVSAGEAKPDTLETPAPSKIPASWAAPQQPKSLAQPKVPKSLGPVALKSAEKPSRVFNAHLTDSARRFFFEGIKKRWGENVFKALEQCPEILKDWGAPGDIVEANHKFLTHAYAHDQSGHQERPRQLAIISDPQPKHLGLAGDNSGEIIPAIPKDLAETGMPKPREKASVQEHVTYMRAVHRLASWVRDHGTVIRQEPKSSSGKGQKDITSTHFFHRTRAFNKVGKADGILVITDSPHADGSNGRLQTVFDRYLDPQNYKNTFKP